MIEMGRATWWEFFKWRLKVATVVFFVAVIPCNLIAFAVAWTPLEVLSHYATPEFIRLFCLLLYVGACIIAGVIGWAYATRKVDQMLNSKF